MKVLAFLPTHRNNPETLMSVDALQHDGIDVFDIVICRAPEFPQGDTRNILSQFRRGWSLAREGKYDALLTIESDMIFPPDGLTKLLSVDADIVNGVCHMRHEPEFAANVLCKPNEWTKAFKAKSPLFARGFGYGFTLIRRSVIEAWWPETENGTGGDSDTVLLRWAEREGVKMACHFGVICGHIRPDGAVLWPTEKINSPKFTKPPTINTRRVKALHSFGGRGLVVRVGEESDIPEGMARMLVNGGIAEYA